MGINQNSQHDTLQISRIKVFRHLSGRGRLAWLGKLQLQVRRNLMVLNLIGYKKNSFDVELFPKREPTDQNVPQ